MDMNTMLMKMGTSLFQNQELTDHLKYKMHEDHRNRLENHPPPTSPSR